MIGDYFVSVNITHTQTYMVNFIKFQIPVSDKMAYANGVGPEQTDSEGAV